VEIESTVWVFFGAVAVDYGCSHDVGVVGVCTADGNELSSEIKIAVTVAGVGVGFYDNCIEITASVYRFLDSGILSRHVPNLRYVERHVNGYRAVGCTIIEDGQRTFIIVRRKVTVDRQTHLVYLAR
jgi:hypothetical protein